MLIHHLLHFPISLILEKQYQSYLNNLQYYCNTLSSLVLISTNQTLFYSPRTHLYLLHEKKEKRKKEKRTHLYLFLHLFFILKILTIFSLKIVKPLYYLTSTYTESSYACFIYRRLKEHIELIEEQNNMVSFPQTPQIDDEPPKDMDYFPQTPQTSQIESESRSNLDSNEEEEISVKRKMGTPMTYGELDHYALTVQTGEDVVSVMFSLS
ncbi:hypothetical protein PRUPE_6G117800 [Prunus persica]|uniref:Uncharacterized protein n=1 Tax=Prunus persica TaxID=3760 RepID=A0A251NNZ4_PRUPE|nr:hypothetical protein PRUPE_6G117800 [Prunus persica]